MKAAKAKATKRPWSVTHHGQNVHVIKCDRAPATGWEQWIYLRSDAHTDNTKADHATELAHLKEAVKRNAIIIDCGDTLDLMCGVSDRRQSKAMLRSSHLAAAYFDQVITETAERYAPYASHWAVLGQGNHESAWLKHHECDPTAHLVRAIKMLNPQSPIAAGGWGGWVKVQVQASNNYMTWTLRYAHGGSAGGAMTFGVLDTRRMYSWIEGADMIAMGHTHDSNIVGISREYCESRNGKYEIRKRHCDFVRIGTMKDDWGTGAGGWAVEKNGGPKPTRAKWVRLFIRYEMDAGINAKGVSRPRLYWEVFDAQ
jgi:hypothetical protein